jgi:hypothetical protein
MLTRLGIAVCSLFFLVARAFADEANHYQLLPFVSDATACHVNQTNYMGCVLEKIIVLKPNNEFAVCTATFETGGGTFKLSDTPAPSCQPIYCSKCDLIPPISTTENRIVLYRPFAYFAPLKINAATYWAINQQTGTLTVCAIVPPTANCQSTKP